MEITVSNRDKEIHIDKNKTVPLQYIIGWGGEMV